MRGLVLLPIILVLAACDTKINISFKTNKGETVRAEASKDGSESMVTMTGDEGGKVRIGENKAPDGLPEWAPAYENARWTSSLIVQPGETGPASGMMTFQSPDAPASILEFYERKAKVEGLRETLKGKTEDGDSLSARAADGRSLQVTAKAVQGAPTEVSIVWSQTSLQSGDTQGKTR